MVKITPNPPVTDTDEPTSRAQSARNKKLDEAATRALDYYLKPKPKGETSDKSDSILRIDPGVDSECLLANLEVSELLANRALDIVEVR
ncbi:DUF6124 family protein [Pseudomonas sp. R151218B TE3479]